VSRFLPPARSGDFSDRHNQVQQEIHYSQIGFPVGCPIPTFRTTAPNGYLMLDGTVTLGAAGSGATHVGSTYRELYEYTKNVSPNTGTEDWNALTVVTLPDFRGRAVFGMDSMGGTAANRVTLSAADTLGGTGGGEAISQVPAHTHTLANGTYVMRAAGGSIASPGLGAAIALDTLSVGTAGTTASVSVVPPAIFLNWMVKY